MQPTYYSLNRLAWADDRAGGQIPPELLEEAERAGGGGRKFVAGGEGGFYSTYSEIPPGYRMPLHRHDTDELLIVLDGDCQWFDGTVSSAHDSAAIPAGVAHGYVAGSSGMKLFTVTRGPFRTELLGAEAGSGAEANAEAGPGAEANAEAGA